ncbi:hypothetical protein F4818DRAFT_454557 [Hypoxylon cercidicola]|nr:hypothetical protein F4818DRAFT_454557 [Hypoxylon cercidicola]
MDRMYYGAYRSSPKSRAADESEDARGAWATRPEPALPLFGSIAGNLSLPGESSRHQATGSDQPFRPELRLNEDTRAFMKAPKPDNIPSTSYSGPAAQRYTGQDDIYSTSARVNEFSDTTETPQIEDDELNRCVLCEKDFDVWYCNACTISFCEKCWGMQLLHRKPRGRIPHEKTNPGVAIIVHNALSPPVDPEVCEQLYKADASTAWFGVKRPDDGSPVMFQDYGRFTELMTATHPMRKNPGFLERWTDISRDKRTPSLISFVGQTGAGKSTLIKLLIDFAVSNKETYPTPIIGPRVGHLPTSDDVHLYLEPRTADSSGPLLYADCEGLEGGEREPQSAFFKRKHRAETSKMASTESDFFRTQIGSERELRWANDARVTRARSREFAVENLYPRLLYTFSDVIVFALRNPRVIEHVFERLIQWAVVVIETSSNQPALPHAIIALNASEHGLDSHLWDVLHNTENILNDLSHTIEKNEMFKKWAQFWKDRGKTIDSLYDLILCYYSSIQIIRLPAEGHPNLMEGQIRKLYDSTLRACTAARCARYRARMLLDVEELHGYLQDAFNHYSNTLDAPFDFVEASSRNSAIPEDFGGNLLKLALAMMNIMRSEDNLDGRRIFSELSYMVASCIMLDSARNNNKGSASQIFPKYINHLDDALENFCDQHWPCEFVKQKTRSRCVNVRSGHSKGHQSADGEVFATGDWVSNFSFDQYKTVFRDWVYCCLVQLLNELAAHAQISSDTEEQVAAHIHKTMILARVFSHSKYNDAGAKSHAYMVSHTACFCCLFGQAEHFLPCGHVLCSACVRTYGKSRDSSRFEISECPFEDVTTGSGYSWMIQLTPKSAGVRVLALDGGGIRGIVELEVLRQIQIAIGGVPIQCFIDLIVGTSTGGLVALGLASMNWTVEECIFHFENLCDKAFTRRAGSALPIVGPLVDNYYHSKYQTLTLEKAFTSAFTDYLYLFGGERPDQRNGSSVKVAVTATSSDGTKAYVISNYNRRQQGHKPASYHFQRPESASAELKVWEAARATTAAPTYFKSFHHKASQRIYMDGAILHNNPVRIADSERRILWPNHHLPDLFLSIGSGSSPIPERHESRHRRAPRKGIFSHGLHLYGIMRKSLEQALDCEKAWDEYVAGVVSSLTESTSTSRFLRINPNVGEIPALDEKEKMEALREKARLALASDLGPLVNQVARQLIASSFYFQLHSTHNINSDGAMRISGNIRCRLTEGSVEVANFGQHISTRIERGENLQFIVFQDGDTNPLATLPLIAKTLDLMKQSGIFYIDLLRFSMKNRLPTHIHLCFGHTHMHPISGFPRLLFQDNEHSATSPSTLDPTPGLTSQRYTHGSRRHKRFDNKWQIPDLQRASSLSSLYEYAANPTRKLGHDFVKSGAASSPGGKSLQPPPGRTELFAGAPKNPTVKAGIRDAFSALMWPLRPLDEEVERPNSTGAESLPPDLEEWFREYRKIQTKLSVPGPGAGIPPDKLVAALRNYNIKPEEYAMYEQWINLLQPDKWGGKGYWLPPTNGGSDDVARPESPGKVHELENTMVAELMDTSPSNEEDS